MKNNFRLRFAPAPTGIMHIGNVRAALFNYLFAKQKGGTFVLRIEDTDHERNFDPQAKQILEDLAWLGLTYDEGPVKGGPYAPYFQSQRDDIYRDSLNYLIEKGFVYRCFCTVEELDKKRERQIALKIPPKYDKTCLKLTQEQIDAFLAANMPNIWRFKINPGMDIEFEDLGKGKLKFHSENLTDFPLTRTDGSYTFLFANSVDDVKMGMTHVFRGEDHLTNSASQILVYRAFNANQPVYLHLPIVCNLEGTKLSKRDFGFSILDLKNEGFLPQAICNYLGIIGGTFAKEVMSLDELVANFNFENMHGAGQIKYDPSKLKWLNHKWIQGFSAAELLEYARPFIIKYFPSAAKCSDAELEKLLDIVKTDLEMLSQLKDHVDWFFNEPKINLDEFNNLFESVDQKNKFVTILNENLEYLNDPKIFLDHIKVGIKDANIPVKVAFAALRLLLLGKSTGPNVTSVLEVLQDQGKKRILANLATV